MACTENHKNRIRGDVLPHDTHGNHREHIFLDDDKLGIDSRKSENEKHGKGKPTVFAERRNSNCNYGRIAVPSAARLAFDERATGEKTSLATLGIKRPTAATG